uniref:Zinc finger, CCHC-type n=1 Tax=Opuntia streptacantha TaxID=393608 RepID=A0A7C8YYZ5_OPUST
MATLQEMTSNFQKLNKFEGVGFRRWQKKMHFLLTTLKVVYILDTPYPIETENETLDQARRRSKFENDDYICRGHILNSMLGALFDVYQGLESAQELWEALENKYIFEDASSKNFIVSQFNNYKMVEKRSVLDQLHDIQRILSHFKQHNMHMDETIIVSSILDKLPPSWKDTKRTLKHKKEDMTLEDLANHLRIEEELHLQVESKEHVSKIHVIEDGESSQGPKGNKKRPYKDNNNKGNKKAKVVVGNATNWAIRREIILYESTSMA